MWIEEVWAERSANSRFSSLVKPHLHSWCSLHILLKQELEVMETPPHLRQGLSCSRLFVHVWFFFYVPVVNYGQQSLRFAEQVVRMLISHWEDERARSKNILFSSLKGQLSLPPSSYFCVWKSKLWCEMRSNDFRCNKMGTISSIPGQSFLCDCWGCRQGCPWHRLWECSGLWSLCLRQTGCRCHPDNKRHQY